MRKGLVKKLMATKYGIIQCIRKMRPGRFENVERGEIEVYYIPRGAENGNS